MKNVFIAILTLAVIALGAVLFLNKDNLGGGAFITSGSDAVVIEREFEGETLAKVDGKDITDTEIKERLDFITGGRGGVVDLAAIDNKGLEALAREAAVQRKILKSAYEAGIQNDSVLQDKIKSFVENVYKEKYLETIAKTNISDAKIKELYEELVSKAKKSKQYKVRHILVKDEISASAVKDELKKTNFADAAKKYSIDKPTAVKGGDLGYVFPEEYVVEFADAVRNAKLNQVVGPVKTEFGYHLLKVEDARKAEIIPFEKAEPRLEKQLGSEAVRVHIEGLSKDMKVEILRPEPVKPASSNSVAPTEEKKEEAK